MRRHRKTKGRRFLSILLALSVLLSVSGITVFVEAVSENGMPVEGDVAEIGEEEADVLRVTASLPVSRNTERGNPTAPVHNCIQDKQDTTTWSYVYFGSYPQSEVTDDAIKEEIDKEITVSGNSADVGIDVSINGTKYRRICKSDTNTDDNFNNMPTNNGYRYFKWEPIKWKVLKNDGNTLFVMADKAIDCKNYDEVKKGVTWEDSTVRNWLNNNFYDTAFSSNEQSVIVPQNIVNEDNPSHGTEGGNDTNDKVYLLSIDEVMNGAYGFCSSSDASMSRKIKSSDYANARGITAPNCCWLRSPGSANYKAAMVFDGEVNWNGMDINTPALGVCPSLHITLSSDRWSLADGSASEESGNPANPVHDCVKGDFDDTTWSYVYFGSYPQSEVTDVAIQNAIDAAVTVSDNSADTGTDVWVDGTKYRRISKADTNLDVYFDEVTNNGYRYFKWERIKWKVLENDGNTLFLVADKAIDCKTYNERYIDITWEDSSIRNWLKNSFYATAFNSSEQSAIMPHNVVNEDNPDHGTAGGNETTDKVYLLSISEVTDGAFGFCRAGDTKSMSRRTKTSDYANARGARRSSVSGYEGDCRWHLRSSGKDGYNAAYVNDNGEVNGNGDRLGDAGVCPALYIDLSSDFWLTADDGTSGEGGNGGKDEEEILQYLQAAKGRTEYVQGEELNLNDLQVTAVYGKDSKKELPSGSYTTNAEDIDMNTPGSYTLEISYTEKGIITKKAFIKITVKEKPAEITQQPDDNPQQPDDNPQQPGGNTQQPGGSTQQPDDNPQNQPVKVTKLTITAPSKKLAAGKKVKLALKAEPENATDKTVTWKTSNAKYATVDENGKVALKMAGTGKNVTITATANDGSGKKATIKLKIMKHAVKSIKLKALKRTLKAGKSMTVKATVKTTGKSVNKTLKWASSNTKYATVSKSGKVIAKKAGKGKIVTITAASTDGSNKKATIKIKIK